MTEPKRPANLIAFAPDVWESGWQRPQQLLARMAAYRRVLYVEQPVYAPGSPHWSVRDVMPNVRVCQPHTPVQLPGFSAAQAPVMAGLLAGLLRAEGYDDYAVWLGAASALPLLAGLAPRAVIYDSAHDEAGEHFGEQAADVLAAADLIFTASPDLYHRWLGRHKHLYLFPSGVDTEHFVRARGTGPVRLAEPASQARLRRPRLGYYGRIDERVDMDLLAALADTHPEWDIALVGALAESAVLPQRANVHYLGDCAHADAPAYLAGWDVALLPLARRPGQRRAAPSRVLEYMAAERMIVSTPAADLAQAYGDCLYVGDAVQGFIVACERALAAPEAERTRRANKMRTTAARASWTTTARAMEFLIDRVAERRRAVAAPLLSAEVLAPAGGFSAA